MAKPLPKLTPLTPAERRAIIDAPFPTFRVYGGSGWAGHCNVERYIFSKYARGSNDHDNFMPDRSDDQFND